MALQVVESFEERRGGAGNESKYAQLMDGKIYKVPVKDLGHKSEKSLGAGVRAYAKRKGLNVKIQLGKGYVIVQAQGQSSPQGTRH